MMPDYDYEYEEEFFDLNLKEYEEIENDESGNECPYCSSHCSYCVM